MIPVTISATNASAMTKASVRKTNDGFSEALQQAATKPDLKLTRVDRVCHDAICCQEVIIKEEDALAYQAAFHRVPKAAIAQFSPTCKQEDVLGFLVQKKAGELN